VSSPITPPAAVKFLPPLSSPTLFAFAPMDAATSAPMAVADSPLICNQTTGKVEACGTCDTGCTDDEPLMVRRGPSYSTQLVRRAVSFLFEGEPVLARRKSSFSITYENGDTIGSALFCKDLSSSGPTLAPPSMDALLPSMSMTRERAVSFAQPPGLIQGY